MKTALGWARVKVAAAYAGVSPRLIRNWLKQGLKHVRVGGALLIRYADIDDF